MKNLIYTAIIGLSSIVYTQNIKAQNTTIGVTGGYQLTSFDEFNFDNANNGFNAGVTALYSSNENWGIGADLTYSTSGGAFTDYNEGTDNIQFYEIEIDQIRLTPKFYYFFKDLENNLRPNIFVGPSLGILTNSEHIGPGVPYEEDLNTVDVAGVLGVGLNYQFATGYWFNFNTAYNVGLTKLNENTTVTPDNLKNNIFSVNLGLSIALSKAK